MKEILFGDGDETLQKITTSTNEARGVIDKALEILNRLNQAENTGDVKKTFIKKE